jgi:hypothetical protein
MNVHTDPEELRAAHIWADMTAEQKLTLLESCLEPTMSATQLAETVRRKYYFPITRNTVIGVVSRAGLTFPGMMPKGQFRSSKPAELNPQVTPKAKQVERRTGSVPHRSSHTKPLPKPKPHVLTGREVKFVATTDHTCKWPINGQEPGPDMLCCGEPTTFVGEGVKRKRHAYCEKHRKLAKGGGTLAENMADKPFKKDPWRAAVVQ